MEWLERGINIIFLDNPTISSDYIRQMMNTAESQDLVTKTAMEGIIKLLFKQTIVILTIKLYRQNNFLSSYFDGIFINVL